ncbi:TPA: hypothetical protein J7116_004419 [Escherichia coli]|nr:hypothetical protein [Escherichia coli]HAZ7888779.1 hypothetical protein [Escherichia coli]
MKDQITHLPDNADRSVAKQKFKITNWPTYNKALINRGSITFWLDDEAIQAWYESATPSSRGRPQRYSDLAITTVLVIKRVNEITDMNAQIATAVEQQGAVSEDINRSIINIRDAADTNVQTGQNNLQSAKSVAQLTSALSELAKQFWEKRG